jgi:hypothetical protein
LRQTTPLGEDTLNFPQKVARQFDGNVVFSRYLAAIFAAFEDAFGMTAEIFADVLAKRTKSAGGPRRLLGSPLTVGV